MIKVGNYANTSCQQKKILKHTLNKFMHITLKLFLRSLSIQASRNFWRMQNLGFAFSMIPLVRQLAKNRYDVKEMLDRHLQIFNTHPYLSGAVIGTVANLEWERAMKGQSEEADTLKKSLMAPYAAIGDSFFWGALKPLAAVCSVLLGFKNQPLSVLALLLIYNTLHVSIRWTGLIAGYKMGKVGINFIKILNLPQWSRRVRWLTVLMLGILACNISESLPHFDFFYRSYIIEKTLVLAIALVCFWAVKEGISVIKILYCVSIISVAAMFIQ